MAFVLPSIYTAIDKLTGPNAKMAASVQAFADKAQAASARMERGYRRMPSLVSDTTKELLSFANSAALVGGALLTVKSIMDYETEMANLKALTGKTGAEFLVFQSKIKGVAEETSSSAVQVTKAFTAIANNSPALAENANALASVTKSSILLAQAARMELQPAGEALTQIMNQFGLGAEYASRAVDILAAGSVKGSSEITDTAAAIQKFGTVAANSMIKLDESVALIELASKFEKGAEAGRGLKNMLLNMSNIKILDPKAQKDLRRLHVNMDIVSNSTLPLGQRLKELSKISKDNAAVTHVFEKENAALATGILSTITNYDSMLESVQKTGQAQAMADQNNKTFMRSLEMLRDKFITYVTTSDEAANSLSMMATAARWVSKHLSTIVKIGVGIIAFFAAWKALIWGTNIALAVYNVALGITGALSGTASIAIGKNAIAMGAYKAALWVSTAAQYAFNLAMTLNPIGAMVMLLMGLVVALGYVIYNYKSIEALHADQVTKKRNQAIQDEIKTVQSAAKAYEKYGLSREEAQKRAIIQERANVTNEKVGFHKKYAAAKNDSDRRVAEQGIAAAEGKLSALNNSEQIFKAVNNKADEQDAVKKYMETTKNANVNINIKDPNNRVEAKSSDDFVNILTSSTMQ
jgi:TP901 family phage tail tape measure protein